MLLTILNSYLYTEIDIFYVNSYIQYIIEIIKTIIISNDLKVNIILGNVNYSFNNNNKVIKININWEHTLVKRGGRDIANNCHEGKVFTNDISDKGVKYLVRIDKYDDLNCANIIIDYSIPNIYNIYSSQLYNNFYKKMVYISPVLFEYNINHYEFNKFKNRQIDVLTTFINLNEKRRKMLLDNIKTANLNHTNINNCFKTDDLEKLCLNTKILINIHQTDHHHTFEELRCLPALFAGVIVISEESPLNEMIPYNNLIIWTPFDKIIETVIKVTNNYEEYHNRIFKHKQLLNRLHDRNINKLSNFLLN